MQQLGRILAALDLGPRGDAVTPGSRKAMERAAWLARRVGGSVTLLHASAAEDHWDAGSQTFVAGGGSDAQRHSVLDSAVAALRSQGVDARVSIRPESAWLAIIREVLREQVDVVVAGKRTDVHSDERKLGTVARKLLRKCPCAVWLEDARRSAEPSVILAATDLTPVGDRVVQLAAGVADALDAELHVVHAYSLSLEMQLAGGDERRDYERGAREQALARIQRSLASTPLAASAVLHVGLSSPTQAVLEGVAALRPGLVVMGTVSRGGVPGLLIGNTAERLLDRIDCALLTIKPEGFVSPVTLDDLA